ncbi:MAG: AAA family ATPase [Arcobacteraceae bacterium]
MLFNIIGNKGGIGKTTISAYVVEYLLQKNSDVICIDTDPENRSFTSYQNLNVIGIQLKDTISNNINKSAFDEMIEIIIDNKDKDIVIDNGAASFNPLINYMAENSILELLQDEQIENVIIGIVAGGGNTVDSLNGLKTLFNTFFTNYIIFNNQLMGSTKYDGKQLHEVKVMMENKDKILGTVNIEKLDEYQTNDIVNFAKYRMLFGDLAENENFKMMQKRRLFTYRDSIFNQLDIILNKD